MFVPLRFSMIPSAKFQAPLAGFGKWYTGIPGMKETWVGNEQILKVFEPFEASLPIKAMLGESTSSTDDLGLEDPDHAAMKDAVLSDNPKLKDVVEFLLMAADVFGDMNNEATQHIDHGTEFWSNILTGESLETAQANAHESSRLLVQNSQYSIAIATQHANIKALLGGGMENADPAKLLASYQELHNNLQNLLTNMAYGAGRFGHDFDKDMYLRYDHARKAASKRMQLLMGLG